MHRSICVIFRDPRAARQAYRRFIRSPFGRRASSVRMHHGQLRDGKLEISQTRPAAGAVWGSLSMAALGAVVMGVAFGSGTTPALAPWLAVLLGAAFGGGIGALAGVLVGTTEPEKPLSEADALLVDGRAALVAEFDDPTDVDGATRMLMNLDGAEAIA